MLLLHLSCMRAFFELLLAKHFAVTKVHAPPGDHCTNFLRLPLFSRASKLCRVQSCSH
jgi:hypothetical protein